MTKLSDTARVILSRACQHPERLTEPPRHLPGAARDAVVRSLLKQGLREQVPCPREHLALPWRQDEDGVQIALRITDIGLRAIGVGAKGVEPDAGEIEQAETPVPEAAEASQPSEAECALPAAG
jgi:hypothetical protein